MSTKNTSHAQQRFEWLQQIGCDKELGSTAVRVGLVLSNFINSQSGDAWPAISTLAGLTGLSERAVQKSIRALITLAHLKIQDGGGRRKTNIYRLNHMPHLKAERANDGSPFDDANPERAFTVSGAKPRTSVRETVNESANKPRTGVHPNHRRNNRRNQGEAPARGFRGMANSLASVIGGDE